jgi:small subunit ribosomal protein S1
MSKEVIRPDQYRTIKSNNADQAVLELNDAQKKELLDLYEGIFDKFKPNGLIMGKIVRVDSDGVLVDINYKSHGLIPKYEFGPHELKSFKEGQDIEVILDELESAEGNVVLSYEKAKARRAWAEIMKLFEANEPVQGVVTHKVKGGLSIDIGIPAFLPGSQIDLQRVTDFDKYVGQTITANILKVNQKRGNVIVSRRKYLHDLRSESRKEILGKLTENAIIQGIVKNITNYGVFIDIGGVDGLLHITDMTWGRISHPSEMVKIGETVSVKVLSFDENNEKISLGLKQLTENPWAEVDKKVKVGQPAKGKISSITDYGLFVEVAPNVEGLVHISEISWTDRINDLHKKFKEGQEIEVMVVSLDKENRRMSLSIKQLAKNPWELVDQEFKVGQKIKGTISNITDFGIFVQLLPGIDGLVHISDLSWTEHIEHPRDRYAVGQEVEAIILSIDKDKQKISLGIKQLSQDPWENVAAEYSAGALVDGEVSKITNFGAFIKLPLGIEGLLHNATLVTEKGKKAEELFKVGEKVKLRVINVNQEEHKIGLSTQLEGEIKQAAPKVEKKRKAEPKAFRQTQDEREATPKMKSAFQQALESAMNNKDEE